jgi:transposase
MTNLDRTDAPACTEYATVHLAFELSKARWMLGMILPGAPRMSRYTIAGGDLEALAARLADARAKAARTGKPVRILSCYEAGFDGHWLHRWLTEHGVMNHEIDPSSIEVNRRARRSKTDRIDLDKLMRAFLAHLRGEPRACSVVHVPSVEEEDRKRRTRERERLLKERTAHTNRIKGLLHANGVRNAMPLKPGFLATLDTLHTGDGRPLSPRLKEEIVREHDRLALLNKQLVELEAKSKAELRAAAPSPVEARIKQLIDLKGLGPVSGEKLVNEVFYRSFDNRRQVGSYFGLTGTPYDSGQSRRDQGISKAGNRRARELAIELAWLWLRHQPDSALSRWFRERVRDIKGRIRRIAIVALARKLMVALWRYLETGMVPTGAVLRPSF